METRRPKPGGLGPEYGGQFRDQSVADGYPTRPPYPSEVFDLLLGLVPVESPVILDLGCGTGDISRPLAPRVRRVDAVDPSLAMIERGQALEGGRHPNLRWFNTTAEDFHYPELYALVVMAESLRWMDWYTVLPRTARSLMPGGRVALVGRGFRSMPWAQEMGELINKYSTNREYERFDLLRELRDRQLFEPEQLVRTQPIQFSQTLDDYVESFHSRNGLSRDRMGDNAEAFDNKLRRIILRYQSNPILEFELTAEVAWGTPQAS